tara:strand:- start:361 stop:1125 length:765 start_codon:yes stop_codon:yes gene_type:complete
MTASNMTTSSLSIGQNVNFDLTNEEMMCSCTTIANKRCPNTHKFLYKLSNGNTYTCCGISSHKKYIFHNHLTDGVTANVYRYRHECGHNNLIHCSYIVCGIDIDNKCNYEFPVIKEINSISNIKSSLQENITEQDRRMTEMKNSIAEFSKYITNIHREMYLARELKCELSRALAFVDENATFTNNKNPLTEQNDLCAICHEQMTNSDSTKLSECNHAFHLKCIKRWFNKKNTISCPCCRTICNKDNYFVLNKFV